MTQRHKAAFDIADELNDAFENPAFQIKTKPGYAIILADMPTFGESQSDLIDALGDYSVESEGPANENYPVISDDWRQFRVEP